MLNRQKKNKSVRKEVIQLSYYYTILHIIITVCDNSANNTRGANILHD